MKLVYSRWEDVNPSMRNWLLTLVCSVVRLFDSAHSQHVVFKFKFNVDRSPSSLSMYFCMHFLDQKMPTHPPLTYIALRVHSRTHLSWWDNWERNGANYEHQLNGSERCFILLETCGIGNLDMVWEGRWDLFFSIPIGTHSGNQFEMRGGEKTTIAELLWKFN